LRHNPDLQKEFKKCIGPDIKNGYKFMENINNELLLVGNLKLDEILSDKATPTRKYRDVDQQVRDYLTTFLKIFVNRCAENVFQQIIMSVYNTTASLESTETKKIVKTIMDEKNGEIFGGLYRLELLRQCAVGIGDKCRRNNFDTYLSEKDYSGQPRYIETLLGIELSRVKVRLLGVNNSKEITYYKQQLAQTKTKKRVKSKESQKLVVATKNIKDDIASSDESWRDRIPRSPRPSCYDTTDDEAPPMVTYPVTHDYNPQIKVSDLFHPMIERSFLSFHCFI
jgi:hypothetical protein